MGFISIWKQLFRRKEFHYNNSEPNQLSRCLTVFDLTALGVGSTVGLGMYILSGQVAATKTGPSVIISFILAAIASLFAAMCYAEFGAKVPRAGSAYVYSYVSVGEFIAFVIGWNMILEYIIGAASVARGYSGYVSALFHDEIIHAFNRTMHMNIPYLSPYPDFLAFGITLLVSILLAIGVKESSKFNNIFTALNMLIALFVIIAGSFKADTKNWNIKKSDIPIKYQKAAGSGGFMPFGFSGMISGAATCFYAFVGFDIIATTGEEAKNPQFATPIAIILSLVISFVAYFGVSTVQTLMVPYYLQDNEHPLSFIFDYVNWPVASWIVAIGALTGLSTSILGSMFPLPRVVYSMASDGLIFRSLGHVHPRFKTPFVATIIGGLIGGFMAMMFDVEALTSMMSIGTLLAYTLVAISVLILRFSDESGKTGYMRLQDCLHKIDESEEYSELSSIGAATSSILCFDSDLFLLLVNHNKLSTPSSATSKLSKILIAIICALSVIFSTLLFSLSSFIEWWNIVMLVVVTLLIIILSTFLYLQPRCKSTGTFMVPFVPFLPIISVNVNMYLMVALDSQTWVRFAIWMAIGLAIYFGYGISNSSEKNRDVDENAIIDDDHETDVISIDSKLSSPLCKE